MDSCELITEIMWKYKEEYKLDRPETIGETDYTFDLENYREWLEGQLTECRKQLSIAIVVGQSEQLIAFSKWKEEKGYNPIYDHKGLVEEYMKSN